MPTVAERADELKWDIENGVRTAKEFAKLKADSKLWPKVKKALKQEIEVTKSEFGIGSKPSKS